jgi:hypothetical protein
MHDRHCKLNDGAGFLERRRMALLQISMSVQVGHMSCISREGMSAAWVFRLDELEL